MSSPIRTVAVRNLAAHKVRLALTVISVLLGTAFVAGSFVFTDTLGHTFDKIFTTADKGVDSEIAPRHSYDPGVPTDLLRTVAAIPGVKTVEPDLSAPIVLIGPNGKKVDSGGAPSVGANWLPADQSVSAVPTFQAGHAPTAAGQVVINSDAARKAHITVGDHVKVVVANADTLDVTVSGIYRTSTETGGYIGVLFEQQQATQALSDGTHLDAIRISAQPGVSERALTDRIAATLPASLEAKTGNQVRSDDRNSVQSALSFINIILLAFGLIALVVGTFIIYNTFSMLVAQRLRELALLRAIGADRKQIRRSVVLEAAVTGVIGSALGLAGGVGLAYGLHALLNALNVGLPSGSLVLEPRTVIVTLLLGTGVTMLSAYAPARRAAKVPPVAAMRAEFATTSAGSLRRRTRIGVALLVVGLVLTGLGLAASGAGAAASFIGLGLLGSGAGVLLLSPVLARWIIGPLGRLVGRPFGPVGQLARTNAVRNPRRTAATAFALTLGLLLVSGIAVIGASVKTSVGHLFDNSVTANYILSTQAQVSVPTPAAAAAAKVPGVGVATQILGLDALVDGHEYQGTAVNGPLAPVFTLHLNRGGGQPVGSNMLVSQTEANDKGWTIGSRHAFSVPGSAPITETITGIYADNQLAGPWVVDSHVYYQLTPRNEWSDEVVLIKAAPGTDLAQLRSGLERATDPYYVVQVQDRAEYKGQIASQINGLLGLLYGLLGLAIVIAILGIINTLALSVVERRREIGMLRAVGMQRKQVRRTIYVESMLIAVFGAVLGLALGMSYGAMFTKTLHSQGLDSLSVPWGQALLFLVLAAVVGVLAALWPGVRAARTRPLDAIVDA
jgi:putative ABC transport system permease protein